MASPSSNVRVFFHERYVYDVVEAGSRNTFDIEKARHVRDRLVAEGRLAGQEIIAAPPASLAQLRLVHTESYIDSLNDASVLARLLMLDPTHPWDDRLLQPFLHATGGTIAAARYAHAHAAIGFNLGGGFHHAQADKAEGFCALADVAIAIRLLQRTDAVRRTLIIDLDYHHGNGNAAIFAEDESVFTLSIHAGNWCWITKRHNLDIELPPGTGDATYLAAVREHIPQVIDAFRPDFVVYVAGADPFIEDMLGDFEITELGMLHRDRFVTEEVRRRGLPLTVVTAGGYGPSSWRIPYNYLCWLLAAEGDT